MRRGRRYDSRRFDDAHGNPMPAYVVGKYVIEKNRRDWVHRVPGQYVGSWAGAKEWWEVRRQGTRMQPGVSIGRHPLYDAETLQDCLRWIEEQA